MISLLSSGVRLLEIAGKNSQAVYLLGHGGTACTPSRGFLVAVWGVAGTGLGTEAVERECPLRGRRFPFPTLENMTCIRLVRWSMKHCR